MSIFVRLFSFTKPYSSYLPQYFFFYVIATVLGAVNFAFLIPLLQILFDSANEYRVAQQPTFDYSLSYFKELFYYHFYQIINTQGKIATLYYVCAVLLTSVFITNLSRFMVARTLNVVRADMIQNIRNRMFDSFLSFQLNYFSNERRGELLSRMATDVQEIERNIIDSLNVLFKGPITILLYFGILISISLKLTLFTLIFLPIVGGVIAKITQKLRKDSTNSQQYLGEILVNLEEMLSSVKIIKAFTAQESIRAKFYDTNSKFTRSYKRMSHKREFASPFSETMGILAICCIIIYGGTLILDKQPELSPESFLAYVIIFSQVIPAFKDIANLSGNLQRGLASGRRIFEIIDEKPQFSDKENATVLPAFDEKITFENVSFAYTDEVVLKNINLTIPKGKVFALVGQSGGGKSTLVDLIVRYYEVKNGRICIDGTDIKDVTMHSLRQKISVVTQESILFNDTIYNNILFGNPSATEEQVIEAAKIANAHLFIEQMQQGYQTNIGDSGVKLSGGQRQRLSIARAVLKNAPILILDEATSALDSESEKLVQDALQKLMQNRTAIVIAHRLSTIQQADQIVVIEKGQIAEQGTHQDLIQNREGIYYKLQAMQQLA